MLIAKKIDIAIINGRLIGTCISGLFLLRVWSFAFLAIRRINIPVVPPEITPPIPKMNVNPIMWKYSARM